MKEIFKDIPNYEGLYQVSNLGNVKSLSRKVWCGANSSFSVRKERILNFNKTKSGHLMVSLYFNKIPKKIRVHKLVLITFCGYSKKEGFVIDHINNVPSDNRLENLQVITHRENSSKDRKGYSSKYTGVHWSKRDKTWYSQIIIDKKKIGLGSFKCELAAAKAYTDALNSI